jgi:hypothetical protein
MLESNLVTLSPDHRSLDFGLFLIRLSANCHSFEREEENSENEFRNEIRDIFLEIQNYLSE